MTATRCRTSSATSRSTTRPTAKTTATGTTPISASTAASRGRPTIPRSSRFATGRSATSWRRCCLSLGVPMLLAGDEFGHTQHGNNNAYCQDNEISWLDWENIRPEDAALRDFVRYLIRFAGEHRVFSRPRFFRGEMLSEAGLKDITWVTPAGVEAAAEDWANPVALSLGYVLCGAAGEFYTRGRAARHRRKLSGDDERLSRRSRFPLPEAADAARVGSAGRYRRADRPRRTGADLETGRSVSAARAFLCAVHQPRADAPRRNCTAGQASRPIAAVSQSDRARRGGRLMRRHHPLPFGAEIVSRGACASGCGRRARRASALVLEEERGGGADPDAAGAGRVVVGDDRPRRRRLALSLPRGRRRLPRPGFALSAGRRARRQRGRRPRRLSSGPIPAGAAVPGKKSSSTSCISGRFPRAAISPARFPGSTISSRSA